MSPSGEMERFTLLFVDDEKLIEKPFSPESIVARVRQLYEIWWLKRENKQLKTEIGFKFKYEKMIGSSTKMLELKRMISQIGLSDATAVKTIESPSGKRYSGGWIRYNKQSRYKGDHGHQQSILDSFHCP